MFLNKRCGLKAQRCSLEGPFLSGQNSPPVPDSKTLGPEGRQIMQAVCFYYRLGEPELAKSRRGWFNAPRAVAIHLVRLMRKDSFADIASAFGLRGYSSVGNVLEGIKKRLATDPELNMRCRCIMESIVCQWVVRRALFSLKFTLRATSLHCQTPETFHQELLVHMIVCCLIRTAMLEGSRLHNLSTGQLSFTRALTETRLFLKKLLAGSELCLWASMWVIHLQCCARH